MLGHGYSAGIDWWALGALAFEMLVGHTPFADPDAYTDDELEPMEVLRRIGEYATRPGAEAGGCAIEVPSFVDPAGAALVRGLLELDPARRLGTRRAANDHGATDGATDDVRRHAFFRGVDWDALVRKLTPAPWRPEATELESLERFEPLGQRGSRSGSRGGSAGLSPAVGSKSSGAEPSFGGDVSPFEGF